MRAVALLLVFALQLGWIAPAFAQNAPPPSKEATARAKDKYNAGKRAYRLGDFDLAIKEWSQAYHIVEDPTFLYNIGRAHREKKDYEKAIYFYESFLKDSKDEATRTVVEQQLVDLRKLRDAQKPAVVDPPP